MIWKLAAPACVVAASLAAACTTASGGAATDCGGAAYQAAFGGGDFYSPEDRSRISGILRNETDPSGAISPEARQRVVNVVGEDGAAIVATEFARCRQSSAG